MCTYTWCLLKHIFHIYIFVSRGVAILIWVGLEETVEVETKDATAAFTREMEVETRMAPVETQELLWDLGDWIPLKTVVGRPFSFLRVSTYFRVQTVSFREGIESENLVFKDLMEMMVWKIMDRYEQLYYVAVTLCGPFCKRTWTCWKCISDRRWRCSSHLRLPEGKPTFFLGGKAHHNTGLLQEPTEVAPWQNIEWVMLISHPSWHRHDTTTIKSSSTTCSWSPLCAGWLFWGEHQQHGEDLISSLQGWNKINVHASLYWSVGIPLGLEKWQRLGKGSQKKHMKTVSRKLKGSLPSWEPPSLKLT